MKGFAALLVVALIAYWVVDAARSSQKQTPAPTKDSRDQEIEQLKAKVAALETKPAEHHYEFREIGFRNWRFDPATGSSCIQLTTKADWKRPETIRQGCQYQDWAQRPDSTPQDYLSAECYLVANQDACTKIGASK